MIFPSIYLYQSTQPQFLFTVQHLFIKIMYFDKLMNFLLHSSVYSHSNSPTISATYTFFYISHYKIFLITSTGGKTNKGYNLSKPVRLLLCLPVKLFHTLQKLNGLSPFSLTPHSCLTSLKVKLLVLSIWTQLLFFFFSELNHSNILGE